MKILLGALKGRNFYMPHGIRPTPNIIRKAIFDILGQDVKGLSILELYAGSGAMGFEAISLGAKKVTFVESDPAVIQVIEDNCRQLGLEEELGIRRYEVVHADAFFAVKQWSKTDRRFDLLFADPPYGDEPPRLSPESEIGWRKRASLASGGELAKKTLKHLTAHDILQPACLLIIQHQKRESLPETSGRFSLIKQRIYGSSYLSVYEARSASS